MNNTMNTGQTARTVHFLDMFGDVIEPGNTVVGFGPMGRKFIPHMVYGTVENTDGRVITDHTGTLVPAHDQAGSVLVSGWKDGKNVALTGTLDSSGHYFMLDNVAKVHRRHSTVVRAGSTVAVLGGCGEGIQFAKVIIPEVCDATDASEQYPVPSKTVVAPMSTFAVRADDTPVIVLTEDLTVVTIPTRN